MIRHSIVPFFCVLATASCADAQVTWNTIATPLNYSGLLGYDSWRHAVVHVDSFETSEFDGFSWQVRPNVNTPEVVAWVVFDELAGVLLAAGGPLQAPLEVWEYDGVVWQSFGLLPQNLFDGTPVFHRGLGRVVVATAGSQGIELYQWNGQAFSLLPATAMPPTHASGNNVYSYLGFAYDEAADCLVLFGRHEFNPSSSVIVSLDAITWEWDPTNGWINRGISGALLRSSRIWFDRFRGTIVRFDWQTSAQQMYLRTPGGNWTQMGSPAVWLWNTCYDWRWNRLYSYNPHTPYGMGYFGDVHPAAYEPHAAGCQTASAPSLSLSRPWTRAWLGQTLSVDAANLVAPFAILSMGFDDQTYNSSPLPLALAAYGMPGCNLNIDAAASLIVPAVNNRATVTIPIPNHPALVDMPFYQQAFALVPGANPLGMLASDSVRGTVGRSY